MFDRAFCCPYAARSWDSDRRCLEATGIPADDEVSMPDRRLHP